MTIIAVPALKDNYIWSIVDPVSNRALIVDPGEREPVENFLQQGYTLAGIVLTHHHWDHTNAAAELAAEYDVPVFGAAIENIPAVTVPLTEGDKVIIDNFPISLTAIAIPGHTLGHTAYYAPGMLFSGDTLFAAGCGRLFEGTAEQMYHSLQKLAALPPETNVYCGHEYTLKNLQFAKLVEPDNKDIIDRIKQVTALREKNLPSLPSTLKDELATNPFLRCQSPTVIASVERHVGKKLQNPIEVFAALRKWKDNY